MISFYTLSRASEHAEIFRLFSEQSPKLQKVAITMMDIVASPTASLDEREDAAATLADILNVPEYFKKITWSSR